MVMPKVIPKPEVIPKALDIKYDLNKATVKLGKREVLARKMVDNLTSQHQKIMIKTKVDSPVERCWEIPEDTDVALVSREFNCDVPVLNGKEIILGM